MNLTDFVLTKVLAMFLSTVMTLSTTPNSGVTYYGECSVTAYSGTPGVTYGASGNTLEPWKSVAGSRSTLPLGTLLFMEDIGFVTVEDRLSEWYEIENDHMVIDILETKNQHLLYYMRYIFILQNKQYSHLNHSISTF